MNIQNLNTNQSSTWPLGFESGYFDQYAWQFDVSKWLSVSEQISIGVKLCVDKEKTSINLADTLRNSYEPTRYVLEKPFRVLFKKAAKELCKELINLNDVDENIKNEVQSKIVDKIKNNLPKIFIDKMTYFYRAHRDKRSNNENDQGTKEEFAKLIIFQFVNAAILNEVKNDVENLTKVSMQLNNLRNLPAYKEMIKDLIQKLDNNAERLPPLPEISPDLKSRYEEYLSFSKNQKKILEEAHNNINSKLKEKNGDITNILEKYKLDKARYDELYKMKEQINNALIKISHSFNMEDLKEIHQTSSHTMQMFFDRTLKIALAEKNMDLFEESLDKGANIKQKTTDYERGFFQRVKDIFTMKGGIRNFFINPERNLVDVIELLDNTEMKTSMKEKISKLLNGGFHIQTDELSTKEEIVIEPTFNTQTKKHEATRKAPMIFSGNKDSTQTEMDKSLKESKPSFPQSPSEKKFKL